jgi:hypothetical protein
VKPVTEEEDEGYGRREFCVANVSQDLVLVCNEDERKKQKHRLCRAVISFHDSRFNFAQHNRDVKSIPLSLFPPPTDKLRSPCLDCVVHEYVWRC